MKKLSLRMKLAVGFGASLLVLAVVSILNYFSFAHLSSLSADAAEKAVSGGMIHDMQTRISQQQAEILSYIVDSSRSQELEAYSENDRLLADDMARLLPFIHTEKGKQILSQIREGWAACHGRLDSAAELSRTGKTAEAARLFFSNETQTQIAATQKSLQALADRADQLAEIARRDERTANGRARLELLILALLGLAVGTVMIRWIGTNILRRVSQMVATMQAITDNDLSMDDMVIRNRDEIGQAGALLNTMKNGLRQIIHAVAANAELVANASVELTASSEQSFENATAQRNQGHQVATTMHEMSAAIAEVSASASRAAQGADEARAEAHRGGEVVNRAVADMQNLNEASRATSDQIEGLARSSHEIGKVISVIGEIAEQTNLLALNAAIEAARAGEQGRGFAVVAGEVRRLAERTGQATREVSGLIAGIQAEAKKAVESIRAEIVHVNESAQSAEQAGTSIAGIIAASENVKDMISQIATASSEQASATEEVNRSMAEIARGIDVSTATTQETTKACEELSRLAVELQQLVSRFRLEEGTKARPMSPAPAALPRWNVAAQPAS